MKVKTALLAACLIASAPLAQAIAAETQTFQLAQSTNYSTRNENITPIIPPSAANPAAPGTASNTDPNAANSQLQTQQPAAINLQQSTSSRDSVANTQPPGASTREFTPNQQNTTRQPNTPQQNTAPNTTAQQPNTPAQQPAVNNRIEIPSVTPPTVTTRVEVNNQQPVSQPAAPDIDITLPGFNQTSPTSNTGPATTSERITRTERYIVDDDDNDAENRNLLNLAIFGTLAIVLIAVVALVANRRKRLTF